jgi:uncharacterized protein (DUF4415 family)
MPKLQLPPITDEEEARIQAGIAADPDNPEVTDAQAAQARPFAEAFPELAKNLRRSRGPQKAPTKQLVSLRLDPETVETFKATGPGWQSRMNEVLRAAARDLKAA